MAKAHGFASIEIGRVTLTARALFAKHMAIMLRSGLTLVEALAIARDSARGKLRAVIEDVLAAVERGRTFSDALSDHPRAFPAIFVETVRAGEASGTLSENLDSTASELEKEREFAMKIKGAMMYPIIVFVAAFFLALGVAFFVLPKITPLFEGLRVSLPASTRALIWFSHFIEAYGTFVFFGLVMFFAAAAAFLKSAFLRPFTHALLLRMPIVGPIARGSNIVRTTRTLALLLKSGLPVDEALRITRDSVINVRYKRALGDILERTAKGARLSDGIAEHSAVFPIIVARMVRVGEESGRFEETLFYLANFYESEVDSATKSLATTLEPVLLLLIGLIVGWLAIAIITPIYEITGNIRR